MCEKGNIYMIAINMTEEIARYFS
uniref:Uncharacterized protein n=1 Tax=Anguilla anguilla TaxID=7936 RepID=A0A0E9U120_ANGAN